MAVNFLPADRLPTFQYAPYSRELVAYSVLNTSCKICNCLCPKIFIQQRDKISTLHNLQKI